MFDRLLRAFALLSGLFFAAFITQEAQAQGFLDRLRGEPQNFDDCILQGMRGVTSDQAARAIYAACQNKHPVRAGPPSPASSDVTHLLLDFRSQFNVTYYGTGNINAYHNTPRLHLTALTVFYGPPGRELELRCHLSDHQVRPQQGRLTEFYCGKLLNDGRGSQFKPGSSMRAFGYLE